MIQKPMRKLCASERKALETSMQKRAQNKIEAAPERTNAGAKVNPKNKPN